CARLGSSSWAFDYW
nr:immunoglobulin heavy chain junction region [Macaca mulatta]